VKRSRILYFHPETNEGKILALEALSVEYRRYLQTCLDHLISQRRMKVPNGEILRFFPAEKTLNTNLVAACQRHAVEIISGWTASLYTRKIKPHIKSLFKAWTITEAQHFQLFTIGKYSIDRPTDTISQEALDLYWTMLLDPQVSGKTPSVSSRIGMRMSIHTSTVRVVERKLTSWWLGVSTLTKYRTIKIPLKSNPHVKSPDEIVHGCMVRKDRRGRWRVEVLEKKPVEEPKLDLTLPRIGVDVGLNVMAATSDGRLLGADVKPKFDKLYARVRDLRANRQRQGFKENSPRLDRLEDKLTGMIKTCAGGAANKLVTAYPSHVFVIEDLDLRGCRGQKRFAYRALHHSL
jgi:transposase